MARWSHNLLVPATLFGKMGAVVGGGGIQGAQDGKGVRMENLTDSDIK